MLALDVSLKPDLAFNIVLPIFAAAIVGGLGQPYRRHRRRPPDRLCRDAGGVQLDRAAQAAAAFLPEWLELPATLAFVPTEYKLIVAFVILVVVLIWRPTGIFKGSLVMIAYRTRALLMISGSAVLVALVFAWLGAAYGVRCWSRQAASR